jgi:hypothetical protein
MTSFSKNAYRWWFIVGLVGLWAVMLAQSCDRNAKRADNEHANNNGGASSVETADKEPVVEQSDTSEKTSLPGEAEPGSIQPDSPGPKAPGIFFTAGLKGYLEPCGCSADVLLGGIDRIVGYVDAAEELYPATAMIDAGDLFFEFEEFKEHEIPQEKAKSDVIVAALKELGTQVTVPGERDFALGTDFYLSKLEEAGVEPIAGNLKIDGKELAASKTIEVGDLKVKVFAYVQPDLYEGIEGVEVTEPHFVGAEKTLSTEGEDVTIMLVHGDLATTQTYVGDLNGVDFGIVGHGPRETDQVYAVDDAHTLEAYDQGRYLGVLKVIQREQHEAYKNAGAASQTEIEKIEKLVAHKKGQLERFPPSKRRENPPILKRLKEDIAKYEAQLQTLRTGGVEMPDEGNAFIYRPVPMEPGLPISEALNKRRNAFNKNLQDLQMKVAREIPPVEAGEASFVGNGECASCHVQEQAFWETTKHAHAVETLEKRNKLFDQSCIGCHVVGYEKPGGSVIGKLHYEAELGDRTIEKNLEDVGCENCHGPGSKHIQSPLDASGTPQHIDPTPGEDACMQCHVPEHSPKFNFDAYLKDITGEGHEMTPKSDEGP